VIVGGSLTLDADQKFNNRSRRYLNNQISLIRFQPTKYILKGSINNLKKFQDDERFLQEEISKWLNMFEDWLHEAMQRKDKEDVSSIFCIFLNIFNFNNNNLFCMQAWKNSKYSSTLLFSYQ